MDRRTRFAVAAAATTAVALAGLPPTVSAQGGVSFYKVTSVKGAFDHSSSHRPPCEGEGKDVEQHAEFALRRTKKGAGGMLVNRTGSLIAPLKGGFDGVFRGYDCRGAATSSCEVHYGYPNNGGFLTLTVQPTGKVTAAVNNTRSPGSCPLPLSVAIFVGEARVTKAKLRKKKFTLRIRETNEIKASDGTVIGSEVADLRVTIKRARK